MCRIWKVLKCFFSCTKKTLLSLWFITFIDLELISLFKQHAAGILRYTGQYFAIPHLWDAAAYARVIPVSWCGNRGWWCCGCCCWGWWCCGWVRWILDWGGTGDKWPGSLPLFGLTKCWSCCCCCCCCCCWLLLAFVILEWLWWFEWGSILGGLMGSALILTGGGDVEGGGREVEMLRFADIIWPRPCGSTPGFHCWKIKSS